MKKYSWWAVLGLVLCIAGLSLIVSALYKKDGGTTAVSSATTKLKVKLKWLHQAQFAGFYVAEEKFYKAKGLEVELLEKGQDENALMTVVGGNADIGVWGAEQIILNRAEGRQVRAIGVIYQQTPMCWMVHSESPVHTFSDVTKEIVGVQPEGNDFNLVYRAVLAKLNIPRSKLKEQPVEFSPIVFRSRQVDLFPSYITNEPFQMEKVGVPVRCITPATMGIDFYGDTIFATDSTLQAKSEAIRKFMEATAQGWDYALTHVEEAVDITIKKNPVLAKDRDAEIYKLQQSAPLIKPAGGEELLTMSLGKWSGMARTLTDLGLIKSTLDVNSLYTDKFLPFK